nr:MAG TPA: hypothetical protein [Caudoviricetes sp.]
MNLTLIYTILYLYIFICFTNTYIAYYIFWNLSLF